MDNYCQHIMQSVEQRNVCGNAVCVKEERNKCFLGASQNTSLLSSSSLVVNSFCCQGASRQLAVTSLAKWRANDSTVLINTLQGRRDESPMEDNDNN